MASRMIGRAACPECGFSAAHVKQSEKCLYRYCPECHAQYNTRTEQQRSNLMAKTRPTEGSATATASQSEAHPSATATATPPEATAGATATATAPPPPPAATVRRNRLFG